MSLLFFNLNLVAEIILSILQLRFIATNDGVKDAIVKILRIKLSMKIDYLYCFFRGKKI